VSTVAPPPRRDRGRAVGAPSDGAPSGPRAARRRRDRPRRSRLRSLQTKIGLVFFAIIALAFGLVFVAVVPQLRSNLESQRLDDLERDAMGTVAPLRTAMGSDISERRLNELVRVTADRTDARVTLLGVQRSANPPRVGAPPLYVISDSNVEAQVPVRYSVAERAVAAQERRSAIGSEAGESAAQVAQPLSFQRRADWVAVFSRDLDAVSETVGLIRDRLAIAALAAVALAVMAAFLVARALGRRVRRLEEAADHVAAGDFVEPLPADSDDELGQLTRKFNDMQDQLGRLDRARREFIANASHELRTPIFSLSGFAELLEDEDLDSGTRAEFVSSIREQVDRLKKLAGDLLDLSRLDAGSLVLNPEPVELSELARDVVAEFTPALDRHGTQLSLLRVAEGIEAHCDRDRLAQVLRILIDNAVQHTPPGSRVALSAERRGEWIELSVTDSGPQLSDGGLDPAVASQLFERFYTADAASGSGLGLAIAKELVERMGGAISLRASDRHTVFEVTLPATARVPVGTG
jgi:two-component system OmpR family sensor kinase